MGTRNLTCVVLNNEFKVAQYCQWDGYPSGQGLTVLEFLHDLVNTPGKENIFRLKVSALEWISDDELKDMWNSVGADGSGWVTYDVSGRFKNKWPHLDRDMGAEILETIMTVNSEIKLKDDHKFGFDGLFCEWAYVIDLDKRQLEVYDGFHKESAPDGQRWTGPVDENGYGPIQLKKTYSFDELPENDVFINELKK